MPTADQRNTIKVMAGLGVPENKMCLMVINSQTDKPISEPTLRRAFRRELDSGQIELNTRVGNALVNAALGEKPRSRARPRFACPATRGETAIPICWSHAAARTS